MTIEEFFLLPELHRPAPKSPDHPDDRGFGLAPLRSEGEYILERWESPDSRLWWTQTIDGIRYRITYDY